ncbi:MAG: hypothetical protein COW32_09955 [Candidatus Aquicultor secundus]|uniref:Uncharacterized protein n=1 Tax=Candidatus Aquicultor secundus TaxID=1973895 RepID=A0A2M7T997_9ACTN|nr:hypothetical protein [Candidatus Aquicultor secundus]NCO65278.1 hypothetical protein [Solirubrobacter sp.]OIO83561.1 MAG: hypothetical protein AUK32_09860 [Candidatus Aquicultor secundus]PIU27235.1 MAG: hypothetical protein COT10_04475 [Candidatus Aquicultor secundus]PIW21447.1 MAG: hypothetical protein COW32_09955 [Candidatus Aquicultor secundus]PIX51683.1 MAG: hypothetical protein COZ51_08205 [Candidatus Aquicultor secundus]
MGVLKNARNHLLKALIAFLVVPPVYMVLAEHVSQAMRFHLPEGMRFMPVIGIAIQTGRMLLTSGSPGVYVMAAPIVVAAIIALEARSLGVIVVESVLVAAATCGVACLISGKIGIPFQDLAVLSLLEISAVVSLVAITRFIAGFTNAFMRKSRGY